ncbi:hypothetical protein Tco_1026924 [Tanacetum coccineum]
MDSETTVRRHREESSGQWKVEMDAKREGEPTILAIFGSDRGLTIWDPGIKSAFQDTTLRARWFEGVRNVYALSS